MTKKMKSELISAGYTFVATFLLVIITSFINDSSVAWDGAAIVGAILTALRAALKTVVPFLTNLINGKK
jgi:hypothetical protein